jgi:hypothetical protein
MGRGIKILFKCGLCPRLVGRTFYSLVAKRFVCSRCHDWAAKNPEAFCKKKAERRKELAYR